VYHLVIHRAVDSVPAFPTSGLSEAKIYQLYPQVEHDAIDDALDLERQLRENLHPAVAA
jgi:uncharacterized protein (DUF433 family)